MLRLFIAAACLSLWGTTVLAQPSGVWRSPDGQTLPDAENRRSSNGFGAMLLVTADADWESKWNTPSDIVPHIGGATEVRRGGHLAILTIYSNPQPGTSGEIDVSLDLKVTRPDQSISLDARDVRCWSGRLPGPMSNLRLCEAVVVFVAEPTDITGTWVVETQVKDKVRQVALPLRTSFELRD